MRRLGPDSLYRREALPAAIVAGLVIAWWLSRFVLGDAGPPRERSDLNLYYFPEYVLAFDWMAGGNLPLWNPWHAMGRPWLATLQAGFFYPLHAPHLLLGTSMALAISHVLHLLIAALGTTAFARRIGLAPSAAVLAALIVSLRGIVPWSLQYPSLLEAGAWLPWGCVAIVDIVRGARLRAVVLLCVCTASSLLAGYPQATVLLLYAWGTLFLVLLATEWPTSARGRALLAFPLAALLGLMLSAIQTFPTFELTLEGSRATGTLPRETLHSLGGAGFWRLESTLGSRMAGVGALPLVLAPAALLVRRRRALVLWVACLGLLAHALASGSSPFLLDLYRSIPAVGWFRHTTRLLLLSQFCLALLAAVAVDAMTASGDTRRSEPPHRASTRLRIGIALSLVLALGIAFRASRLGIGPAAWTAGGLAILCLVSWRRGAGRWLGPACVVLAVVESTLGGVQMPRLPYSGDYAASLESDRPFHEAVAAAAGTGRVTRIGFGPPDWARIKISALSGVRWFEDYEPLALGRYATYRDYLMGGTLEEGRGSRRRLWLSLAQPGPRAPDGFWTRARLLDLAAVRLVLVPEAVTSWKRVADILEGMNLAPTGTRHRGLRVFENPSAVPRAYVTYRVRESPETSALLPLLARTDFDPLAFTYLEDAPSWASASTGPAYGHAATIVRDEPTVVEVSASLVAPGVLVLADTNARGWRATVDGEPADIRDANYLYRGVSLPAGRHLVRFEYRPRSLPAGAATTALGIALLVTAPLYARRIFP